MSSDVSEILAIRAKQVDQFVTAHIESLSDAPVKLVESILYSFSAGGKRLRPTILLETFESFLSSPCEISLKSALAAASAMELVHTFSLVHDDLPAMDNDDYRRGKLTNHKVYGQAIAILAGDAMLSLAFEIIAQHAEPDLVPKLVHELATATGPTGMIGGQTLDLEHENTKLSFDQLKNIHRMKTGALITTSCRLGAICARAEAKQLQQITLFGKHIGLAFQIMDDILDETSTIHELGKATQKDRNLGKNTYPSLLGLNEAQEEAGKQLNAGITELMKLNINLDRLKNLANFVISRTK